MDNSKNDKNLNLILSPSFKNNEKMQSMISRRSPQHHLKNQIQMKNLGICPNSQMMISQTKTQETLDNQNLSYIPQDPKKHPDTRILGQRSFLEHSSSSMTTKSSNLIRNVNNQNIMRLTRQIV